MQDAIGGYMGLEYPTENKSYHTDALMINTARSCLGIILSVTECEGIHIPYFTCDVVVDTIRSFNVKYSFYSIDKYFDPIIDFEVGDKSLFLYTNYWGLKQSTVKKLVDKYPYRVIIDSAQSFFDIPINGKYFLFNSCRKFFGVLDGAYMYYPCCYADDVLKFVEKISAPEYLHRDFLFDRIEFSAEKGYNSFQKHEEELKTVGVCRMSKLSETILSSIDYEKIKNIRYKNFMYLHSHLRDFNLIEIDKILDNETCYPMVYPFLTKDKEMRSRLIQNRIYVAKYWPQVKEWTTEKDIEYYYAENIIPLPIDQRLNINDIECRLSEILNIIKNI